MFTCDVCGKAFFKRGNFNRHVARHEDSNQHNCVVCGKVFARSDNLKRHMQSQHERTQVGYGQSSLMMTMESQNLNEPR